MLGQRADATGRRKLQLAIFTGLLIACMLALFFVQGQPAFFILGISLIAAGSVFGEIAGVNYNAMLVQVATPKTVGKVSGLGWGLGYIGGIIALVLIVVIDQAFGLVRHPERRRPALPAHRSGVRGLGDPVQHPDLAQRARGAADGQTRVGELLRQLRGARARTSSSCSVSRGTRSGS